MGDMIWGRIGYVKSTEPGASEMEAPT